MYTAIVAITAFSMAVMLAAVCGDTLLPLSRRRGFLGLFALLIAVNLAEWLAAYLDGAAAALRAAHIAAKFTELTLTPVVPVLCAAAVGGSRHGKLMSIPIGVNLLLQLVSLGTGVIFSVDAANVYHRGPLYLLYMATFFCGAVFLFVRCYRFSRRYQYHNALFLSLILLLVLAAMALPILDRSLRLDWACVSIAAMLFYIYYKELTQQVDALTALLNRQSYNCRLERLNVPAAILFFDVDRFKDVNDSYGHQFGDVCLARMAAVIRAVFGKAGSSYRFGGDEFCVILTRGAGQTERLISAFLHRMEKLRAEEPRMPRVSVGYALFEPSRESVGEAIGRADAMMYEFKQKRRAEGR